MFFWILAWVRKRALHPPIYLSSDWWRSVEWWASKSLRAVVTPPRSLPSVRHLPANPGLRRRSRTALQSRVARRRTVRSIRRSLLRRSDQGSPGVFERRALLLRLGSATTKGASWRRARQDHANSCARETPSLWD